VGPRVQCGSGDRRPVDRVARRAAHRGRRDARGFLLADPGRYLDAASPVTGGRRLRGELRARRAVEGRRQLAAGHQ
jgi:hypothetical protein